MVPTPVFFDTDIGDDVDDLLALAIACASPEVELVGVGTVFGPTLRRTRVARSAIAMAGRAVPVFAGAVDPITPPERNPEFAELIRRRFDPEEGIGLHVDFGLLESELPKVGQGSAAKALAAFWGRSGDGGRSVAVGALTNVALALDLESTRPPLTVMAGRFEKDDWAEWNVKCDPDAAAAVFESGCAIDVIPFEIGVALSFTPEETARFTSLGTPLSDLMRDALALWEKQKFGFHVWDLLALMAAARPELFQWKSGLVRVETTRERFGFTTFQERPDGRHRIAVDAERGVVVPLMIDRLIAAATSCTRELPDR